MTIKKTPTCPICFEEYTESKKSDHFCKKGNTPDIVNLLCPECKSFVPVHCYDYLKRGLEYDLDNAPLILIAEVNFESKMDRVMCMTCGMGIYLSVRYLAYEQEMSVYYRFKELTRKE